jgi:hypothetical protein
VTIERLDVPAMRPRRPANEIERRKKLLKVALTNWTRKWIEWFGALEAAGLVNTIKPEDVRNAGFVQQTYALGVFDLRPGWTPTAGFAP